jgi:hypothetical protein
MRFESSRQGDSLSPFYNHTIGELCQESINYLRFMEHSHLHGVRLGILANYSENSVIHPMREERSDRDILRNPTALVGYNPTKPDRDIVCTEPTQFLLLVR